MKFTAVIKTPELILCLLDEKPLESRYPSKAAAIRKKIKNNKKKNEHRAKLSCLS